MSYEPTVWVDGDHVTSAKLNKLEQGVNSMSYTPTVWNAGDVVTAEKLNKLEQGVAEGGGGGATFPTFTHGNEGWSCDMTYVEAKASFVASADENRFAPVELLTSSIDEEVQIREWCVDALATGIILSSFADVPETVTEGLGILLIGDLSPVALYAEDGNFYMPKS